MSYKVRLGADPKAISDKKTVARVAISHKAYTEQEKAQANDGGYFTQWADLSALGDNAAVLMSFKKGDLVEIDTQAPKLRTYTDKTGKEVTTLDLIVERFGGSATPKQTAGALGGRVFNDSVPF